ncbi:hypothetical protein N9173_01180 [bacterium]|nr:hypothetical protein [bacterium]
MTDEVGDEGRSISRKSRRDHRDPEEPPRHGASREEETLRIVLRRARSPPPNPEAHKKGKRDDDPVEFLSHDAGD